MIHGQHFIDLEKHIDLTEFDSLHLEICRGIAVTRDLAMDGLQYVPEGTMNTDLVDEYIVDVIDYIFMLM